VKLLSRDIITYGTDANVLLQSDGLNIFENDNATQCKYKSLTVYLYKNIVLKIRELA